MIIRKRWFTALFVFFALYPGSLWAQEKPDETFPLTLSDGVEIPTHRFGSGGQRLLWLPGEQGILADTDYPLAMNMAELGMEVWLPDLHTAYTIPAGTGSLRKIPEQVIAEMLELALPENADQTAFLLSSGQGAALAIQGLHTWQATHGKEDKRLGGLILAYPDLLADKPKSGKPTFLPATYEIHTRIYLFQAEQASRQATEGLSEALEQGGSVVYTQHVKDVAAGYLQREESEEEMMQASVFPAELQQALTQLAGTALPAPATEGVAGANAEADMAALRTPQTSSTPGTGLQPYPGNELAPVLKLTDINGKTIDLADYRGKVVLLNFWSTWCPPCIKEIPSLGKLQDKFPKKKFVVLSVDIGEEAKDVKAFLENVPADYPVMLDPDNTSVQAWKLHAFPSTFLIDREGYIRFAYFGGLEWDEPEVVTFIGKNMDLKAK